MNDAHDNAADDKAMLDKFLGIIEDDHQEHQARITGSMSDLEIVNEIIRVAGYDRVLDISDMLAERWKPDNKACKEHLVIDCPDCK